MYLKIGRIISIAKQCKMFADIRRNIHDILKSVKTLPFYQ